MKHFCFDQSSSNWTDNYERNRHFLWAEFDFFREIIRQRGYLYLNQIYEYLGVKWNPDEENVCYKDLGEFHIGWGFDDEYKMIVCIN